MAPTAAPSSRRRRLVTTDVADDRNYALDLIEALLVHHVLDLALEADSATERSGGDV